MKKIIISSWSWRWTASAFLVAPMLKPNNNAFAPDSPSPQVSKRLKGIFKGMGEGFSK